MVLYWTEIWDYRARLVSKHSVDDGIVLRHCCISRNASWGWFAGEFDLRKEHKLYGLRRVVDFGGGWVQEGMIDCLSKERTGFS
jgi:hypothetical protein